MEMYRTFSGVERPPDAMGCGASRPPPSSDAWEAGLPPMPRQQEETSEQAPLDKCRQLDKKLAAAFRRGDIRLLRSAWILASPDTHLTYRQALEALEEEGESPLLSPDESDDLLARADRSIGALTQCTPPRSPGL